MHIGGSELVSRDPIARRLVLTFIGVALFAASLTALFLGMRDVMEIGGACASGGPYVPATPCPEGTWLVPVSIFTGIAGAVLAGLGSSGRAPGIVGLAWPALFLSLGWNFLEYGLSPPDGGGVAVGWLVCAVVFALMGGVPLLLMVWVARDRRTWRRRNQPPLEDVVAAGEHA